jgi:hypothetical protein
MKKILSILLASFLLVGMMSSSALADAAKGQKYYLKFFKKKTGLNGAKFATVHSQDEWKTYFANDAEKFIAEYSKTYPKMEKFLTGSKFKSKYSKHIKDFCIEYANDSGNVPSC